MSEDFESILQDIINETAQDIKQDLKAFVNSASDFEYSLSGQVMISRKYFYFTPQVPSELKGDLDSYVQRAYNFLTSGEYIAIKALEALGFRRDKIQDKICGDLTAFHFSYPGLRGYRFHVQQTMEGTIVIRLEFNIERE